MGATRVRGYGGAVGANVVPPKQLLLEAVDEVIKRDMDQGVPDRENVLRQLEGILNAGHEGIGWTILRGERQLDRQVKETLKRGLVEYIHGPKAPNSGGELTFFVAREIMREFAPRLMLVNFWDMGVAQWGAYSLYLQAVTNTDRLRGMLWDEVQSSPAFKDRTTLLILPEFGRDVDRDTANSFLNHRSGDPSRRNVWMLALGAGLEKGETDRTISHVDIAASAAAVLGVPGGEMEGRQVSEVLVCAGPRGVCAGESGPHSSHAHLPMAATGPASSKAAGLQAPWDRATSPFPPAVKSRAASGSSRRRDIPWGHPGVPAASEHSARRTSVRRQRAPRLREHPI